MHTQTSPSIFLHMLIPSLLAVSLVLVPRPAPANIVAAKPGVDITGLYVATRLNYAPLPRVERVPSTDGWEHWFKLLDAAVTIRPDGRFIASFKYYRQHVRPGAKVNPGPLLNETYKGKYTLRGTEITLIPDKTKEHKVVKPLVGTIANQQLTVPYIVAQGQSKHPLRLDLKRSGNW